MLTATQLDAELAQSPNDKFALSRRAGVRVGGILLCKAQLQGLILGGERRYDSPVDPATR